MRSLSELTIDSDIDARSVLALQASFAFAAYAHTSAPGLVALTGIAVMVVSLVVVRVDRLVVELRYLFVFLAMAPILAGISLEPPWFDQAAASTSGLASYRVLLIVLVSTALVRTIDTREIQAAIAWAIPGRPGRIVAVGVGMMFRILPVIFEELRRVRLALRARGVDARSVIDRIRIHGLLAIIRTFERADRYDRALRMRCLSWNPTMPRLRFTRNDVPFLGISILLTAWAVVG